MSDVVEETLSSVATLGAASAAIQADGRPSSTRTLHMWPPKVRRSCIRLSVEQLRLGILASLGSQRRASGCAGRPGGGDWRRPSAATSFGERCGWECGAVGDRSCCQAFGAASGWGRLWAAAAQTTPGKSGHCECSRLWGHHLVPTRCLRRDVLATRAVQKGTQRGGKLLEGIRPNLRAPVSLAKGSTWDRQDQSRTNQGEATAAGDAGNGAGESCSSRARADSSRL